MDMKLLAVYFVLGGAIVTATTYYGSRGESFVAAFIAFLPSISLITMIGIFLSGGTGQAIAYSKNMLFLLPSWTLYILVVIFLLPRLGLPITLLLSIGAYVGAAFATSRLFMNL